MHRGVVALLLLLPFGLTQLLVDAVADQQATRLGSLLATFGEGLDVAEPRQKARDKDEVASWRAQLAGLFDELPAAEDADGEHGTTRMHKVSAPRAGGVFVSAERVLAIARSGARPSGIPVAASGSRPAGLMLTGVGGLGVGLHDGDILTHALGQPAVSESTVVGAVIRARGARRPQLSGRVWREGRSFSLVVAQPYLDQG